MPDFLKNPIIKRLLTSAIRAGLVALGALLLKSEIGQMAAVTPTEVTALIDDAVPVIAALAWSAYEGLKVNKRIETALNMPAGSSKASLDKVMKITE